MSGARFTERHGFSGRHGALHAVGEFTRAYMEYSDVDWDPPARWDNGIPGIILDYNINNQLRHDQESGSEEQSISGNGTLGANTAHGDCGPTGRPATTIVTMTRTLPPTTIRAGAATTPIAHYRRSGPNLRWAKAISSPMFSTALTISVPASFLTIRCCRRNCAAMRRRSWALRVLTQKSKSPAGRVLYETQVPAGPFRIQDLNQSVSGTLHVTVEEQNGQTRSLTLTPHRFPS